MDKLSISLDHFSTEVQRLIPAFLGAMIRRERNAMSQGLITDPQFVGMVFINEHPNTPVKNFAATLGLQLSSASGLLDRMVKAGLIKRTHSREDRRVVLLNLTAKGKAMLEEITLQKQKSFADIFAPLSPEERTAYLEMMKKVVGHLDEI
jgi:DNA-binding MarR family transcriptional regulator